MVLDSPEGLGFMFNGHHDLPVLGAIIRPCQRLDVRVILQDYMQGMVSYGIGFADAFEQACAIVINLGYLSVLNHVQPLQMSTEFNGKALQSEANSKYRDKGVTWDLPELRDDPNVFGYFWGSRTWTDNDGSELGEDGG